MVRAMVYAGLPQEVQVMARYGVKNADPESILLAICVGLRVDKKGIFGKCRIRELVEARQIAFHLMRELTSLTLTQIGQMFNRDHSTVIYGIDNCTNLLETDVPFQCKYHRVRNLL